MNRRVVITGMGVISALGNSPRELFAALCEGGTAIHPMSQMNGGQCTLSAQLHGFRAEDYLQGRPLRPLDRISQIASAACGLALEQGGWDSNLRRHCDISVVLGTMFGGMHTIGDFDRTAISSGPSTVSPMMFANTVINAAAGQCAIWHDLRGINTTIAAGSISGICAIAHAVELIHSGTVNAVVVGGVDEFSTESYIGFANADLLCTNHTCPECPVPFDKNRNGLVLGEGSGFLVLEECAFAEARGAAPIGEVLGFASAFDVTQGHDPENAISTLARAIRSALERSQLSVEEVGFVSAAANGSVAHDNYELGALAMIFGRWASKLPITAVKSCLGETLGAAGPIQVIAAIESFREHKLPGVHGLRHLGEDSPFENIRPKAREISAESALINGIGLDGNCCSLVLRTLAM